MPSEDHANDLEGTLRSRRTGHGPRARRARHRPAPPEAPPGHTARTHSQPHPPRRTPHWASTSSVPKLSTFS
eukprot:617973-Prymnesium_polylepis.1